VREFAEFAALQRADVVSGRHALRDDACTHGGWVVAVLLSVSFPSGEQGAPCTFDHDEKGAGKITTWHDGLQGAAGGQGRRECPHREPAHALAVGQATYGRDGDAEAYKVLLAAKGRRECPRRLAGHGLARRMRSRSPSPCRIDTGCKHPICRGGMGIHNRYC
jgi:hypothetical protein